MLMRQNQGLTFCVVANGRLAVVFRPEEFETGVHSENASNVFSPHYAGEIFKRQQLPAILDLSLKKIRSGKSHDNRGATIFEKLRFQNVFSPHEKQKPAFSNSFGLKRVLEKLRCRDGSVWTLGLALEIKLRFHISPVYSIDGA